MKLKIAITKIFGRRIYGLFLIFSFSSAFAQNPITLSDANKHVNDTIIVLATVKTVIHLKKAKETKLIVYDKGDHNHIAAVIITDALIPQIKDFNPKAIRGHNVRVTGVLRQRKGRFCIFVTDRFGITDFTNWEPPPAY